MTKDFDQIQRCLLQIEEKLDWGNSTSWHNDVFIELSKIIQEETNVLLSPTTLKRVWGKVNYNSNPSINTLNTLAQFSGYQNWRDFKNKNTSQRPRSPKRINISANVRVLSITLLLAVLVASFLLAMKSSGEDFIKPDFSEVSFSSRPIASGLPNSVVFDFDLKGIHSDSIYIQQYWDRTKTIKLRPDQKQATGQYYFPGYFRAKLLVDGQIGLEHDLFIKSEGWMATIDYEPIPKYFEQSEILSERMVLPEDALKEIALSEAPLVSSFHFVENLGEVSADNFLLKTSMRNNYSDKWAVCSTTRLVILGSKGAMVIPFSIPGCVSEIGLMMGDVYVSGKENDLSMFGTDLSEFQEFEIEVREQKIVIRIGGEEIYSGGYEKSIGRLVGIRYRFLGAGEVEYLKIEGWTQEAPIIEEDFNIEGEQ